MSEPAYQIVTVPVVGEPFILAGVEVTISELNELILFRVPEDTPDDRMHELQELLSEAFQDQNPKRVILVRGPVSLRLERVDMLLPQSTPNVQALLDRISELEDEVRRYQNARYGSALPRSMTFTRDLVPIWEIGNDRPTYVSSRPKVTYDLPKEWIDDPKEWFDSLSDAIKGSITDNIARDIVDLMDANMDLIDKNMK